LRADAHAAAIALLLFGAGQAGDARAGSAVEAGEPLGFNGGAEGFPLGAESGLLPADLLLCLGDALTSFL